MQVSRRGRRQNGYLHSLRGLRGGGVMGVLWREAAGLMVRRAVVNEVLLSNGEACGSQTVYRMAREAAGRSVYVY